MPSDYDWGAAPSRSRGAEVSQAAGHEQPAAVGSMSEVPASVSHRRHAGIGVDLDRDALARADDHGSPADKALRPPRVGRLEIDPYDLLLPRGPVLVTVTRLDPHATTSRASGSPDALLHRGPLRSVRATRRGIRLKQAPGACQA